MKNNGHILLAIVGGFLAGWVLIPLMSDATPGHRPVHPMPMRKDKRYGRAERMSDPDTNNDAVSDYDRALDQYNRAVKHYYLAVDEFHAAEFYYHCAEHYRDVAKHNLTRAQRAFDDAKPVDHPEPPDAAA